MRATKSNRAPFSPRPFRLADESVKARAIAALQNAPIDPLRPLLVKISEEPKKRSNPQNSLYWALLGDIAEQAWLDNRSYTSDIWHEFARRQIMPETITLADGTVRSKWEEMPDGTATVISTTLLSKESFADYITAVEAFGNSQGVHFITKG